MLREQIKDGRDSIAPYKLMLVGQATKLMVQCLAHD